jgi:uncharacterized protein YbjT (DUF2867 family)
MSEQIFVTGASGQQGGAIMRQLLKQGQSVRALTRSPQKAEELKKLGVEVVLGDISDRATLDIALKGIKKMFLVTTPYEAGTLAETQQGLSAVDAARAAKIEHLVYSSVGSAERKTGIPHFESKWKVEEHISKYHMDATILRPVFFMENFGSPWFLPAIQKGALALPIRPDRKLALVTVENIGELGAKAFLNPSKYIGQAIELAGDELTLPESMSIISGATGKPISYQAIPHKGSDQIFGQDFARMFKWFDDIGYRPDFNSLKNEHGLNLIRFADYIKTADWVSKV